MKPGSGGPIAKNNDSLPQDPALHLQSMLGTKAKRTVCSFHLERGA